MSAIVVLVLIYVNINVQVIEGVLGEVNERRLEEAYQKKCSVLCELRDVFGGIAQRKSQNVLVTRCWLSDFDVSNDMNRQVNAIKKLMALNKIEVVNGIKKMHRDVTAQNTQIQIQLEAMTRDVVAGLDDQQAETQRVAKEQELISSDKVKGSKSPAWSQDA